jgi:hypothetical protein
MALTETGRMRTSIVLRPETHQWLKEHSFGQRAIGELIDSMVQEKRLLAPIEQRLHALEHAFTDLCGEASNTKATPGLQSTVALNTLEEVFRRAE